MNDRGFHAVCLGLVAATAVGASISGVRLARSNARSEHARGGLLEARRLVGEIERQRSTIPWQDTSDPPPADLSSRLLLALDAACVPRERLQSVRQSTDRPIALQGGGSASSMRLRSVAVVLEPVTVIEVGAILASWQEAEPAWRVTAIELQRRAESDGTGSLRMDLTLVYATDQHGASRGATR